MNMVLPVLYKPGTYIFSRDGCSFLDQINFKSHARQDLLNGY